MRLLDVVTLSGEDRARRIIEGSLQTKHSKHWLGRLITSLVPRDNTLGFVQDKHMI